MQEHYTIILRTIIAFILLFIATRILGKRTIAQMTIFDYIASITMGSIAANFAFNTAIKAHHMIISFCVFVAVVFLTAFISLKSKRGRKYLAGEPTVVIQNGKILENNMRKIHYTVDYLNQQLREKGTFNIEEVQYAIIEPNGMLTVLKKPQFSTLTKQDLMIPYEQEQKLPIELIMDGKVLEQNLIPNNLTHSWLQAELAKRKLSIKEVVYAVQSGNGNIYIDTYKDHLPDDKK